MKFKVGDMVIDKDVTQYGTGIVKRIYYSEDNNPISLLIEFERNDKKDVHRSIHDEAVVLHILNDSPLLEALK
jgi:hypothetical protein